MPGDTSIHLRLKRNAQTVFLQCNTAEPLSAVRTRLALLLGKDENDIQLYECMSQQRRKQVIQRLIEVARAEIKANKGKKSDTIKFDAQPAGAGAASSLSASQTLAGDVDESTVVIPPFNLESTIHEASLVNDSIVLYVYRLSDESEQFGQPDVTFTHSIETPHGIQPALKQAPAAAGATGGAGAG